MVLAQSIDYTKFQKAKDLFKKGNHFYNEMKYLAAVEFFRKALITYPDYSTAHEYLARSYKLAGFINAALKEWENLSASMPDNIFILNKIDTIMYQQAKNHPRSRSFEFIFSNEYISNNLGRFRFSCPIDLAIDNEKNIYITSFASSKLIKLDSNGEGLSVFRPTRGGRLYGVTFHNNRIAVSNFEFDTVYILNKDLKIQISFGSAGQGNGEFHGPEGLCFDSKGNLYVVDSGNHRIQKFDRTGRYILEFGEYGEYDGQLHTPSDLVAYNNLIYIVDRINKRIACFDEYGNFIKNIKIRGIENPRTINIYNNNFLISDDKKGLLFYRLKSNESFWFNSWGDPKKSFSKLISVCSDRDGNLYCLDYHQERIFVFLPIQSTYSNLDIDITSVDTRKYPIIAFYVNIRNRRGSPIYGLTRNCFNIIEDNANMSGIYIDYLKDQTKSVSLVLCIDRSTKMRGYHYDIPWFAEFVLKKMKRNDSIKVVNFNSDSWTANKFDWSRRRTLRAIKKRQYDAGKNFGKALYNSCNDLITSLNERAIIIITDGSVNSNSFQKFTPDIIINYAKCHYIPIYIITFKNPDPVLSRIAMETGGEIIRSGQLDKLRKIYSKIKNSEEYRYVLVYSSLRKPYHKSWWSDVMIEVKNKNQKGIEWGGYFVP